MPGHQAVDQFARCEHEIGLFSPSRMAPAQRGCGPEVQSRALGSAARGKRLPAPLT